jgi:hypothetical protein
MRRYALKTRKTRLWLLPIIVLTLLLTLPPEVGSQCTVIGQMSSTFGTSMFITKTLNGFFSCMTTAMNASSCGLGPSPMTANKLYAAAMSATMNPFCNWTCNCGPGSTTVAFVIDGSDGLPVELMDFSIE